MLIYHRTSILNSSAQTVVNTVNCVEVMGKGLAAAFRKRYPPMFSAYQEICTQKLLEPGKLWLWKGADQWVLNFPTKKHWRHPSKLEWIEVGLKKFIAEYDEKGVREISFPRLGCGNGGLDWDDVQPLMEQYLSALPISVYVHDYEVNLGVPEHLEHAIGDSPLPERSEAAAHRINASFEDFLKVLHSLVEDYGGNFRAIPTGETFRAFFDSVQHDAGAALRIETDLAPVFVEVEDLHRLWIKLLNGLVTRESIEGSGEHAADRILSFLSALPDVRLVEIQRRHTSSPELAVELRRQHAAESVGTTDMDGARQTQFSWG